MTEKSTVPEPGDIEVEESGCDLGHTAVADPLYTFTDILYNLPGEFTMRRCRQCGLMYLSPRPTPHSIALYYPQDYTSYRPPISDERFALMRWIRQRKLQKRRLLIEQYSQRQSGAILDVGCATGLFLDEMIRAGWQGYGIEPIESAAQFARSHFGIEVFQGMLADATYAANSFDAITFWDVLEHTFSAKETLSQAAALLRPGGIVAISVPNWDSWERRWFGRHWQGFDPPRHLFVFTRATLTTLLEEAGFAVLDWVCFMPSYFSFVISLDRWLRATRPGMATAVSRLTTLPGARLPFEPLFATANRLNKGSVISVFARKK